MLKQPSREGYSHHLVGTLLMPDLRLLPKNKANVLRENMPAKCVPSPPFLHLDRLAGHAKSQT